MGNIMLDMLQETEEAPPEGGDQRLQQRYLLPAADVLEDDGVDDEQDYFYDERDDLRGLMGVEQPDLQFVELFAPFPPEVLDMLPMELRGEDRVMVFLPPHMVPPGPGVRHIRPSSRRLSDPGVTPGGGVRLLRYIDHTDDPVWEEELLRRPEPRARGDSWGRNSRGRGFL